MDVKESGYLLIGQDEIPVKNVELATAILEEMHRGYQKKQRTSHTGGSYEALIEIMTVSWSYDKEKVKEQYQELGRKELVRPPYVGDSQICLENLGWEWIKKGERSVSDEKLRNKQAISVLVELYTYQCPQVNDKTIEELTGLIRELPEALDFLVEKGLVKETVVYIDYSGKKIEVPEDLSDVWDTIVGEKLVREEKRYKLTKAGENVAEDKISLFD